MRMTRELVLCALHRAGEPVDTGTLLEMARDLAIEGGWPPRAVASWTAKALPPMLRGMLRDEMVHREHGTDRWMPREEWDRDHPLPPLPAPDPRASHILDGMTRDQLITMFETQSDSLARILRLADEFVQANARFAREMDSIRAAARSRLYSVGLGDRLPEVE